LATLAPGDNGRMNVHVRLSNIASNSSFGGSASRKEDVVITYRPRTMEELNALLDKLCEVTGLAPGNFTRLSGRLVRLQHPPAAEISFASADREAARHYYVLHPVLA